MLATPDLIERARLDALHQLKLLDTPASESFDRITRMASQIFSLPIAAVSLTDHDRQWFKSRVGITHDDIPRHKAPCAQVACSAEMLVLPDLLEDPHYADSGLAQSGIRFYAGAPLVTRDRHGLGALCVLGTEPRQASETELAALSDLAAMVMSQIELQHAYGRIDPISGFPNRLQFLDDLEDLARDHAGEERIAVLLDLARHDEISNIVRVMGPSRLDEMVREAARELRSALGKDREAYHVAATQFAFIAPMDVAVEDYAAQVQRDFRHMRASSSARFLTTLAVGLMPFELGTLAPPDVLRGAHNAAQDACTGDRGVEIYSPDTDCAHRRRLSVIEEFGKALEDTSQLRLLFQPRIDLANGQCIGAEALLRWHHPTLGDISPAEFIPLIERTAMVRATTDWVMSAALHQIGTWARGKLHLPVSINISASNLAETDLVARLQLHMLKHRVSPDLVELELTESAVMGEGMQTRECLAALAAAGVRLAIDDFGTGYSSLAYLQRVPAHVVKIDRSFVRNLAHDERDRALVASMITLSHDLGYRIVAEGVETADTAKHLKELGCEEGQGFFWGKPMETAELESWLYQHQHTLAAVA